MGALTQRWLYPYWWSEQLDPTSPSFVPRARVGSPGLPSDGGAELPDVAGLIEVENISHREHSVLATLGSAGRVTVDPRGLVRVAGRSWSLDWWIGAADGWKVPSRSSGARQQSVGGTPVIATHQRVPGGEVVHRIAASAPSTAVIEIENVTPEAIAVAIAVRPFHELGRGRVDSIELDGTAVRINGEVGFVLAREPGLWATGTAETGDCAPTVLQGLAAEPPFRPVRCEVGLATAAFVFPLPHTATLRVLVPMEPAQTGDRSDGVVVREARAGPDQIARGWREQLARGARIDLPDGELADRAESAGSAVLLAVAGEDLVLDHGRRPEPFEETVVIGALDALGFQDESEQIIAGLEDRMALDGYLGDRHGHWDANGCALAALGAHWRLSGDSGLVESLVGPIAKAAHWIERKRHPARPSQRSPPGPVPA